MPLPAADFKTDRTEGEPLAAAGFRDVKGLDRGGSTPPSAIASTAAPIAAAVAALLEQATLAAIAGDFDAARRLTEAALALTPRETPLSPANDDGVAAEQLQRG